MSECVLQHIDSKQIIKRKQTKTKWMKQSCVSVLSAFCMACASLSIRLFSFQKSRQILSVPSFFLTMAIFDGNALGDGRICTTVDHLSVIFSDFINISGSMCLGGSLTDVLSDCLFFQICTTLMK